MNLETLCTAAGIFCPPEQKDFSVKGVFTDSRDVKADSLYICIPGLRQNGHDFIGQAAEQGARWILCQAGESYPILPGLTYLETKNTRRAASVIFDAFYGFPSRRMRFIGVTGTNGKTTVTHLLRSILESALFRCGLIGTVGCESAGRPLVNTMRDSTANMTTPDPPELYRMLAEMVKDGVEYVLMEVTSHALALGKLEPIRFDAAIFTNLTPDHLDFHKTMEAYAEAKGELFEKSALCVVNADSPWADYMISRSRGRVVTCSQKERKADYHAEGVLPTDREGATFQLVSNRFRLQLRCGIPGAFSVMNAMQAAVCARELGLGAAALRDGLASVAGVKGRMERLKLGSGADVSVILDYAHTPDALEKLLRTAKDLCTDGQHTVLVFGCGGDRDQTKRPLMGAVAERYADRVIVTSDNSRSEEPEEIIKAILSGMQRPQTARVIPDRADAIREAILGADPGDLILLAGKGHEEYEITKAGKFPFSERTIAMKAMQERLRGENT